MKHLRKSLVIIALLIIAFVVIPLTFKKQAVTAQSDTTNYISYKGYVHPALSTPRAAPRIPAMIRYGTPEPCPAPCADRPYQ